MTTRAEMEARNEEEEVLRKEQRRINDILIATPDGVFTWKVVRLGLRLGGYYQAKQDKLIAARVRGVATRAANRLLKQQEK